MMSKRISAIFFLAVIFIAPLYTAITGINNFNTDIEFTSGDFVNSIEAFLKENLPAKKQMEELKVNIKLLGGMKEQNGVFITQEALIENLQPPIKKFVDDNIMSIVGFANSNRPQTYAVIIPTASAIKQQDLSRFAPLYNQRGFIDSVYKKMSGRTYTIDVYPILFANREKYIYYNTDTGLTALGGYYLYSALGKRLGIDVRGTDQFDVVNIDHSYYGNLYERTHINRIKPDILSLYIFKRFGREYRVTHIYESEQKTYYTLYPEHIFNLSDDKTNIYFGGFAPITKIDVISPNSRKLLLFADDTAKSYLPFLVNHYSSITVVDLFKATPDQLSKINTSDYDQALFMYSIDTFMHTNIPSRAVF